MQEVKQWALAEPIPIKKVERTNAIVVSLNQQAWFVFWCNLYAMNVYCGRNCYSCGGFGHLARICRNREIIERGRRLGYENENNGQNNNLNGEESLIVLD